MKKFIQQLLTDALVLMGVTGVVPAVDAPEDAGHGDYATNVAMVAFAKSKVKSQKSKFKTPLEFAGAIKEAIIKDQTNSSTRIIDHVEVVPPGFINIFLTEASLVNKVERVLKQKEGYGRASSAARKESSVVSRQSSAKAKTGGNKQKAKQVPIGQKIGNEKNGVVNFGSQSKPKISRANSAKRIMVEFADPNPFKEFHIGHLRNITLGESYCRLLEAAGHDVRRVNYQGDVGMHVAKALYGLLQNPKRKVQISNTITAQEKAKALGHAYALGATMFEEDEKAKSEMIQLNKKIYSQDSTILDLWKEGRQWSLEYFDTVYGRLGTKFERFYFESEVAPLGVKIVQEHVTDGVFEKSDGAFIFRGESVGLHTRVFVSKEGYATYEAKDLALAPLKYSEWPYDLSIIMTGNEQSEYFKVMLAALAQISPDLVTKTRHMPFGMVNLKEGKMSSRTGNVIVANWLIDQAKEKIQAIVQKSESKYSKEDQEEITEKAAIAAVKYSMLKVTSISDISFDLEASVSFEGDSGPYLQYTYARCRSVLRKAQDAGVNDVNASMASVQDNDARTHGRNDASLNPEERSLARLLAQFPDVVADAAANFAPNSLCTYLFRLAQAFNVFYAKHTILGGAEKPSAISHQPSANQKAESGKLTAESSLRLALTAATARVIKNGLYLLGIDTLEQM